MRIDIHVHSSRYSPCSWQPPEEMIQAAVTAGLDGIVFTEHDLRWPQQELDRLQQVAPGLKLFSGAEMTTAEGEHVLVYGDMDYSRLRAFTAGVNLCLLVREMGGVSVLAHPGRWGQLPAPALLEAVDGLEVSSSNITRAMSLQAEHLARRYGKFMIVASDSHHTASLGGFALEFSAIVNDEVELAGALQHKKFQLYSVNGY